MLSAEAEGMKDVARDQNAEKDRKKKDREENETKRDVKRGIMGSAHERIRRYPRGEVHHRVPDWEI
jgi:hypothetical protein